MSPTPRPAPRAARLLLLCGVLPACAEQSQAPAPTSADAWGGAAEEAEAPTDEDREQGRRAPLMSVSAPEEPSPAAAPPPGIGNRAKDGLSDTLVGGTTTGEGEASAAAEAAPTRAWFPETFLWLPTVRTDAAGQAQVQLRMPDRLTGWRVLGLAHTMDGAQAGALTRVQTSLPVYVDLVVPPALRLGDLVELPLQAVNTTADSHDGALSLRVGADTLSQGSQRLLLPPNGEVIRAWPLRAEALGGLQLRAAFEAPGAADSVEHAIVVNPIGRPIVERRRGGLGAPRSFSFDPPPSASPASDRLRLSFFPGALAVLRAELGAGRVRPGLMGAAYGLQLSGDAVGLLRQLGAPPEDAGPDRAALDDRLRRLRMISAQRALAAPLGAEVDAQAALMVAALRHPDDASLAALGARIADQLVRAQSPDGTFIGSSGAVSLDAGLQSTAAVSRAFEQAAAAPGLEPATAAALRQGSLRVKVLGEGAADRLFTEIRSPATHAALLAAGLLSGDQQQSALETLKAAIVEGDDGVAVLTQDGAQTGPALSPVRAAAWAALALHRSGEAAPAQRMGEAVLAAWSPAAGWGEPADELLALEVLRALYQGGLPPQVALRLERGGAVLWSETLDAAALGALRVVDLPAPRGAGPLRLVAEPALPGAGFEAELRTMTDWTLSPSRGLEVKLELPAVHQVGRPSLVRLTIGAPAQAAPELRWELPAGVVADTEWLESLVAAGSLRSFSAEDGALTLRLPSQPDTLRELQLRMRPAFAGRLQSGALHGRLNGLDLIVALPSTWVIAAR